MKFILSLLFVIVLFNSINALGDEFRPNPIEAGEWVDPTSGEIWPKPLYQSKKQDFLFVDPNIFQFEMNDNAAACPIITQSLPRFFDRIFPGESKRRYEREIEFGAEGKKFSPRNKAPLGFLEVMKVILETPGGCEAVPHLQMNESYVINIDASDSNSRFITAGSVWGLLRGLESFSQLVYMNGDNGYQFQVNANYVADMPRFPHRGLMIDSSRHFLSKTSILQTLDLLEINKMNVLHWHLTDNSAFPYQSEAFPELSDKGAYDPVTHVYSKTDVEDIIYEAALRGIRIIPEIDAPGHSQSWELGLPGILAKCYTNNAPNGFYGPMDPTKENVYEILSTFFYEIKNSFPDDYIHIGGDEVDTSCWASNPEINEIMGSWNITGDYRALESYFIERLLNMIEHENPERASIVWQEVFDNKDHISPSTIVTAWKNWGNGWKDELRQITSAGYYALLSAPWYLNYMEYGSDWTSFYNADPHDFPGTQEEKDLVLGGEACIWGEFINTVNLIPRTWPRASAIAERLWTPLSSIGNYKDAAPRFQEHECRMLARGFLVTPGNGAGYCKVNWQ